MKNCLMHIHDKILLNKRALIETVNDELKNICQIEHTRHRSFEKFITNLLSGFIANSFFPKKPPLNIDIIEKPTLLGILCDQISLLSSYFDSQPDFFGTINRG